MLSKIRIHYKCMVFFVISIPTHFEFFLLPMRSVPSVYQLHVSTKCLTLALEGFGVGCRFWSYLTIVESNKLQLMLLSFLLLRHGLTLSLEVFGVGAGLDPTFNSVKGRQFNRRDTSFWLMQGLVSPNYMLVFCNMSPNSPQHFLPHHQICCKWVLRSP